MNPFRPVVVLLFGLFLFSNVAHAQQSLRDYDTWDLGANMGLTFPSTDITGKTGFAFGVDATKFLSSNFALKASLIHATLHGKDINRPQYRYDTEISYDFTVNAIVQVPNLVLFNGGENLALYVTAGFGFMHYSPTVYLDGGRVPLPGIYSQYAEPFDTMFYQGNTDFVVPIGFGIKYRTSEKISVTMEYSLRRTYSDKLDGFFKLLSADDNYSYLSAGFVYHLGTKKKLQWTGKKDREEDELEMIRKRLDKMSADSDSDGVADYYDKEPNTPSGARVYGDGTAVDSDGDGNPDYKDEEPFLPKDHSQMSKESDQSLNEGTNSEKPGIEPDYFIPILYFNEGEDSVSNRQQNAVQLIAGAMKRHGEDQYVLVGMCNGPDSSMTDCEAALKRSRSLRDFLVSAWGIEEGRLSVETMSEPGNKEDAGRRVEVLLRK